MAFNAAFRDLLERVEPEKFTKAVVEKEKAGSRAGETWPPLEEVELDHEEQTHQVLKNRLRFESCAHFFLSALKDECFEVMRAYPRRCVMASKTFLQYDEKDTGYLSVEHFFDCLNICRLWPPDPVKRGVLVKSFMARDDKIAEKYSEPVIKYANFCDALLVKEWPEMVDSRYEGQGWRVVELRNRLANRRAHALKEAGREAVIQKKHFDHRINMSRRKHGEMLMEVVGREVKGREIMQQANQQWEMSASMRYLNERMDHLGSAVLDKEGSLTLMEEKLHRLHHLATHAPDEKQFKHVGQEIDHELQIEDDYSYYKHDPKKNDFLSADDQRELQEANAKFISDAGSRAAPPANRDSSTGKQAPTTVVVVDGQDIGAMPPRPPMYFESGVVTETSIQFKWEPPIIDGGSRIIEYEINYSIRYTTAVGKKKTYTFDPQPPYKTAFFCAAHPIRHHGIIMTGLTAGVEFGQISVRCMNQIGWSKPSNTIEVITMPPVGPPSPPLLLIQYGKLTSSSFSFMWNGPLMGGGAIVTHYEISFLVHEEVIIL
jgi:hypothetical protein